MRSLALLVLLVWSCATLSGDHQWVACDALESGESYMIRTPADSLATYLTKRHGVVRFPSGGFFKIYERIVHDGGLWYRTKWIKPRLLDPNDNIEGWMKVADLREHGAWLTY